MTLKVAFRSTSTEPSAGVGSVGLSGFSLSSVNVALRTASLPALSFTVTSNTCSPTVKSTAFTCVGKEISFPSNVAFTVSTPDTASETVALKSITPRYACPSSIEKASNTGAVLSTIAVMRVLPPADLSSKACSPSDSLVVSSLLYTLVK
ncbi:hypothetical protein D3C81_1420190 [compost metagenome]